jgi:hypothetical protein
LRLHRAFESPSGKWPTIDDILCHWEHIIAWHITGDLNEPVFVKPPPADGTVFIKQPDGKLSARDLYTCDTLDEARHKVLEHAQAKRDRDNPAVTI